MGFSSYNDLISEITSGKISDFSFYKSSTAPEAAGVWHSLWTATGTPGIGATPATTPGTQYSSTAGGIVYSDQSPDTKHILTLGAAANQNCTLMLYDRLVAVSGISVASTGNKTVNSSALLRYTGTSARGVQAWLEVTTATTTTAPVVNLASYTDQDGNTAQAGGNITFPAAATNLDALVGPLPIAVGDLGIRSVETLNVGTAANAGVVNVVLLRPLAFLPLIANQWNERDLVMQLTALPQVFDGATLAMAYLASGTTATQIWGNLRLGWG